MPRRLSFATALAGTLLLSSCQAAQPATPATQASALTTIHGMVSAAPGARVEVEGGTFQAELAAAADGSFSVQVPAGTLYDVTAIQDDGQGKLLEVVAIADAAGPDVNLGTLVPQATGAIHGLVALADGGDPAGADVFVPGTHLMGKVGPDGRFALDDLPAGDWTIVIEKPGYQRFAMGDLTVEAGEPLVIASRITLAAGEATKAGLKAVIDDAQGQPVVGGQLTAIAAGGQTYQASADAAGNLQLAGLPPGTYQVTLFHPFMAPPPARTVTVADGAPTDLGALTLGTAALAKGTITGQVTDEAGKPIAGAAVRLDPPGAVPAVSDTGGHFTFGQVEAGEYTVNATATGYDAADRGVVLANVPAATAHVDQGLVLRTPSGGGAADRPALAVQPPEVTVERSGDDLIVSWAAEGLPPGASAIDYQLEGEVAPGVYVYLGHTTGTTLTLQGYGQSPARLRLKATAVGADPVAGYRLAEGTAVSRTAGTVIAVPSAVDLKGLDLETAMMAVQQNRANLLEAQLKEQMAGVATRNDTIRRYNEVTTILRGELAKLSPDVKATDTQTLGANTDLTATLKSFSDIVVLFPTPGKGTPLDVFDAKGNYTKAKLEAAIERIKGLIDALNSSQQMDMLRLQSLSNKRNEAFDLMTNFLKKMAENRGAILGNMR